MTSLITNKTDVLIDGQNDVLEDRVMAMARYLQEVGRLSMMQCWQIIPTADQRGNMEIKVDAALGTVVYNGHNSYFRDPWAGDFITYELEGDVRWAALRKLYSEFLPRCQCAIHQDAIALLSRKLSLEQLGFHVGSPPKK